MEEELTKNEQHFRSVLEHMSEGVMLFDPNINLIYQNPASLKIHGFASSEDEKMQQEKLKITWQAWDENDQPIPFDGWPVSRVFRGELFQNMFLRVHRPETGKEFYATYNGSPIYDQAGAIAQGFITIRDITDEFTTQLALKESEAKFRDLANSMPQLVFTANANGAVDYYNEKYKEIMGITKKAGEKEYSWSPALHPDDVDKTTKAWNEAIANKTIYQVEQRVKMKDGNYQWFLARAIPSKNARGNIAKWYGTATNIDEVKNYQQELLRINRLNELITNNATLALFLMDDKQQCTFMNPAAEKMTGFTFQEVKQMNKPLHDIIHHTKPDGSHYPMSECPIDRALPTKTNIPGEDIFIRPDGTLYPVAFMASAILRDGKPVGTVIEVRDTTEEKKREEALQKSESKLRKLFDANIAGIIYWNIKGTIIDANDVFLKAVGYTREDMKLGKIDWTRMTPPEYEERDKKAVASMYDLGYHPPIEKEYIKKDGSRVPVLVGSTFIDANREEAVGFVLDITNLKKLERMKDEFLGVASHELKTPLTSVKAYAQAMHLSFKRKGDMNSVEILYKMDKQINKLNSLISDLLDVTKIEAGKLQYRLEYFNFNEVINEVIEEIQRIAPKHVIVSKLSPTKRVYGDRDRIGQVLTNLLTNAIKYSPLADKVVVSTNSTNDKVTLCVEDFGVGITEDIQHKVFERFYRETGDKEETYPGLGLGLYICSEIIKRHHGKLWVDSKKGHGSKFYFFLPLNSEQ